MIFGKVELLVAAHIHRLERDMTNPRPDWAKISPDCDDIQEISRDCAHANPSLDRNRRRTERNPTRQYTSLTFGTTTLIADLVELSRDGARVRIVDGTRPALHAAVSITLFDGYKVDGSIIWSDSNYAGIAFTTPISDLDDRLQFEDLGQGFFSRALALQKVSRSKS